LAMQIQLVENWGASYRRNPTQGEKLVLNAGKIAERIMKFIIGFYKGIKLYHEYSTQGEDPRRCEAALLQQARTQWRELHGRRLSLGKLFVFFRSEILNNYSPDITDLLLGRNFVCRPELFNKCVDGGSWVKTINDVKHKLHKPQNDDFKACFDGIKQFFHFLRSGEIRISDEFELQPVYPMVISFDRALRRSDGLTVSNYVAYSFTKKTTAPSDNHVNVLSPRMYAQDEQYYCIPQYNRSTKSWWLEPFLIPCSGLNEAFLQETPDDD